LSDTDYAKLLTLRLTPGVLPPDPSNIYADDVAAAQLGKRLFFEGGMSGPLGPDNNSVQVGSLGMAGETGKVACVSCHDPARGGADLRSSPGASSLGAGFTGRNSPTVINAAIAPVWQFWDGRKDSLWSQALGPTESGVECNGNRLRTAHFIYENYRTQYEAIFGVMPNLADGARFPRDGKPGMSAWDGMAPESQGEINRVFANFGKAIAAYERRLTSLAFEPSPFDRYLAGERDALTPAELRGAKLFVGRASCTECHRGPLLSDLSFHNIGAPQAGGEHIPTVDEGRSGGVPSVRDDIFNLAGDYSDAIRADHLPQVATPGDVGRFKTPTLRNVARTAPYLHNGVYRDLWDVMNHYNFGGATGRYSGEKDPAMAPLLLTDIEMGDIVAFLESLSDGPALPTPDFPEGLVAPPPR
jgi:cytochrome c peroxidase